MRTSWWRALSRAHAVVAIAAAALAGSPRSSAADEPIETPMALVDELADLGPRLPSTPAHDDARDLLADRLSRLGVEEVRTEAMANGTRNVEGLLRGADPGLGEIVLAAHYDTVAESPGAADDAAGCAVALGVVAELLRAPLRRSVRVVFFDGEEAGLLGSEAWVERLLPAERDRILASLHLDTVAFDRDGAPVVLDLGGTTAANGPSRAPAWLVHAVLKAGAAVGFPFRVDDHVAPIRAQVLTRTARMPWSSDAVVLLEAGIPSVVLTDFSALHPYDAMHTADDVSGRIDAERLGRWVLATAAVIRRLDALEGRPRWEEEYLAFGGRVWIRRDLLWIGLALWIAMVLRGRPGRWAGARRDERRARGRSYLPGYLIPGRVPAGRPGDTGAGGAPDLSARAARHDHAALDRRAHRARGSGLPAGGGLARSTRGGRLAGAGVRLRARTCQSGRAGRYAGDIRVAALGPLGRRTRAAGRARRRRRDRRDLSAGRFRRALASAPRQKKLQCLDILPRRVCAG